jgi:hypothetical protein
LLFELPRHYEFCSRFLWSCASSYRFLNFCALVVLFCILAHCFRCSSWCSFNSGRCLLIPLLSLHPVSCIDSALVIDSPLSLINSLFSGDFAFVFCSGISWILFKQVSLYLGFSSCFNIDLI